MNYGYQNNPYLMNPYQGFQQNQETIPGCTVDSIDVVKSRNCSLDGSPTYYPKSDRTEIYCKQLNPQTGISNILIYKLVEPEIVNTYDSNQLGQMIDKLQDEVLDLKNMLLENLTSPSGGDK